jgi:hypothetical protein
LKPKNAPAKNHLTEHSQNNQLPIPRLPDPGESYSRTCPEIIAAAVIIPWPVGFFRPAATREKVRKAGRTGGDQNILVGDMGILWNRLKDNSADLFLTDPIYADVPAYERLAELAAAKLKPGGLCLAYAGQMHLPQAPRPFARVGPPDREARAGRPGPAGAAKRPAIARWSSPGHATGFSASRTSMTWPGSTPARSRWTSARN